jgi:hypothetical protein
LTSNCDLLGGIEFRRLPQNAQHRDAVAADLGVEFGQGVDRFVVDAAVIVKRRRRNRKSAGGLGGEFGHGKFPLSSCRGDAHASNPESRGSGFALRAPRNDS